MTPLRIVPRAELARTDDGPTRGWAHIGWGDYPATAPGRLDFGSLLMFADGELRPGEGFPMHRHAHVENLLVMRSGRFRHEDSEGNARDLGPDDVYNLSAGSGIEHSERVVGEDVARALVIWIRPRDPGAAPSFESRTVPRTERRDRLALLASSSASDGVVTVRSDASVHGAVLSPGATVLHSANPDRRVYAIALDGAMLVNGERVEPGDRILLEAGGDLRITAIDGGEVVLVELAR